MSTWNGVRRIASGPGVEGNRGGRPEGREGRPGVPPDAEVPAKAVRRRFSAEYKLGILREVETCEPGSGELGALLRREGLYSSLLTTWRRQRARGELEGLTPRKRGRKAIPADPLAKRVKELERDNQRLQGRLEQAEAIIEVQKKVSELLGTRRKEDERDERP